MSLQNLTLFPRLELIGAPTPLEYLPRLSDYLGREIFIKRDDVTPLAMGGNKLRKLEFLAADALREGADTLIPPTGAISGSAVSRRSHPVEPCPSDGSGGGKTWPALRGAAGKPNGYPG